MANIGTLAVNVVARTGKFLQGMQSARKSLNSFAMNAKTAAMSTAGFAGGLLALGAGAGFVSMIRNSMESIDATAKLSDRLNIATEDLVAFQHAGELAGVTTEQFTKGIEKFVRNIGDVRSGVGQAARSFEILGLSADSLANMDTGAALGLVADKINELPTAADKAAAATALFGRAGGDMLNLLAGGSEGLEAAKQKMEELGLSFSRLDAAKVEQANDAITDMKGSFMGAFQTLAIEFAPAIVAMTEKVTALVSSGEGMKSWMPTLGGVAKVVGIVADVLDVFHDTFMALQAAITKGIAFAVRDFSYLGMAIEEVANLIPGVEVEFSDTLTAMADGLDKLASEQWEDAKNAFTEPIPSEGITRFVDDIKRATEETAKAMTEAKLPVEDFLAAFEANEGVQAFTDKLREQIDTFGMTSREAEISKMAAEGASAAFLNEALALDRELTAKEEAAAASQKFREEMESMRNEGMSLMESLRTPMEQFDAEMADLFRLRDVGAIDETTFSRAAEKAKMDLADSMVMPNVPTGAAAIDARSAEGISRLRSHNKDPMKDALKVAEEQLVTQKAQHEAMKQVVKNTGLDKLVGVSIP